MKNAASIRHRRPRSRPWGWVIALALFFHLLLFLSVKPSFFEFFRNVVSDAGSSSEGASGGIVAIAIEIEGEESVPANPVARPRPVPPSEQEGAEDGADGRAAGASDLRDILGETLSPLPSESSGRSQTVPPRPVEITWPETRKLGNCADAQITILVHVGAGGEIIETRPKESAFAPECIDAALKAASRIRFQPGMVKGRSEAMWTEIRIDFRQRR